MHGEVRIDEREPIERQPAAHTVAEVGRRHRPLHTGGRFAGNDGDSEADPHTDRAGFVPRSLGEPVLARIAVERDAVVHRPHRTLRDTVGLIDENCEPSPSTVLFMGGAGGSLRAGVTNNPVRLTQSIQGRQTRLTSGGAECYIWPGGGITFMVDVTRLPKGAFGYVPTPALVAPLEFTLPRADYEALGGHVASIRTLDQTQAEGGEYPTAARVEPWPDLQG